MKSDIFKVNADELVTSQWQSKRKSVAFLIYRWSMFLIFLTNFMTLFALWCNRGHLRYFFIYFSIWNIILCNMSTFLGAVLVTFHHYYEVLDDKRFDFFVRMYSVISNTSSVMSLVIAATTIVFHGGIRGFEDFIMHAFIAILLLVDQLVTRHKSHIWYALHTTSFAIIYGNFTYVYYCNEGENHEGLRQIYPLINWERPNMIVRALLLVIAACIFLQFFIDGLQRLRLKVHEFCFTQKSMPCV